MQPNRETLKFKQSFYNEIFSSNQIKTPMYDLGATQSFKRPQGGGELSRGTCKDPELKPSFF